MRHQCTLYRIDRGTASLNPDVIWRIPETCMTLPEHQNHILTNRSAIAMPILFGCTPSSNPPSPILLVICHLRFSSRLSSNICSTVEQGRGPLQLGTLVPKRA